MKINSCDIIIINDHGKRKYMHELDLKILIVVLSLVLYGLLNSPGEFDFSVKEWEKLVNVILKRDGVYSIVPYDVNGDGGVDVKDLCLLCAKISGEQGKKPEKRNSNRSVDAVIIVSNQTQKSLIGEQDLGIRFTKYGFKNGVGPEVIIGDIYKADGRNFFIGDFGYLECNKRILVLRC